MKYILKKEYFYFQSNKISNYLSHQFSGRHHNFEIAGIMTTSLINLFILFYFIYLIIYPLPIIFFFHPILQSVNTIPRA